MSERISKVINFGFGRIVYNLPPPEAPTEPLGHPRSTAASSAPFSIDGPFNNWVSLLNIINIDSTTQGGPWPGLGKLPIPFYSLRNAQVPYAHISLVPLHLIPKSDSRPASFLFPPSVWWTICFWVQRLPSSPYGPIISVY